MAVFGSDGSTLLCSCSLTGGFLDDNSQFSAVVFKPEQNANSTLTSVPLEGQVAPIDTRQRIRHPSVW